MKNHCRSFSGPISALYVCIGCLLRGRLPGYQEKDGLLQNGQPSHSGKDIGLMADQQQHSVEDADSNEHETWRSALGVEVSTSMCAFGSLSVSFLT